MPLDLARTTQDYTLLVHTYSLASTRTIPRLPNNVHLFGIILTLTRPFRSTQ